MNKFRHGGNENVIYDFSANINPIGMPKDVRKVLSESMDLYERYPDTKCEELADSIARFESDALCEDITCDMIVCGNGAADILYRIINILRPKKVLIPVPAFVEYEKAVTEYGGHVIYHYRREEDEFLLDYTILEKIKEADMLIICNPNNPTGDIIDKKLMKQIIDECKKNNTRLLVDECFMDFAGKEYRCKELYESDNAIILRAFTKICAIPGLRLGYSLCRDKEFNDKLRNVGQCWSVSVPAQLAGKVAAEVLKSGKYIDNTRKLIEKERKYLEEELKKLHFKVYPSKANYIFFYTVTELYDSLKKKSIGIRDCENYECLKKGYYRIAIKNHDENEILIKNIRQICAADSFKQPDYRRRKVNG